MSPGRAVLFFAALLIGEAGAVALIGPSPRRLRRYVDVLAVQGLLIAVAGAFLAADRPFLAAREIARRARKEPPPAEPAGKPRWGRSFGVLLLVLGGASFGMAALAWSVFGKGSVR